MTITPLPAHPLANLFPMLDQPDLERLADDICTFGQREPIIVLDGQVLDGRNRQAACVFADIAPVYQDYAGDDPLNFVLSLNLHRRHLTESQRAMVAAKIVDWDNGLNQTTAGSANLQTREAARRLSISERAVAAAKRIRDNGSDQLIHAIEDGRISVNAGEAVSWLEKQEQDKVVRAEEKAVIARAKEIRDSRRKNARKVRLSIIAEIAERGQRTAGALPRAAYPILYADPAWEQEAWDDERGQDKGLPYPSMPLDEIKALCAGESSPATRDAKLYLWVPTNRLDDGVDVLRAWGFDFVSAVTWDKVNIGMGREVRDLSEHLLIGKRGDFPGELMGTQMPSIYREAKGAHSVKPAWFAEQIERLYPDLPKLEMFARQRRPGWDAWGHQAEQVPPEDLYPRAIELVQATRDTGVTGLARRLGIERDEASSLIDRMIAEKVLPLAKPVGRKAVA